MKTGIVITAACIAGLTLGAADLHAQRWGQPSTPRAGACFYEDNNYQGRYFCSNIGAAEGHLRNGADDEISSIRIFGNAEVIIFKDSNYKGSSRVFTSSVRDLKNSGFNDRMTSYRIGYRGQYGAGNWGGGSYGGAYGGGSYGGWGDHREPDRHSYGGAYGGGGWSNQPTVSHGQAQNMVRQAYRTVLRREADPSGLASWTKRVMDNNWSQRELERELRNTDEYRNR